MLLCVPVRLMPESSLSWATLPTTLIPEPSRMSMPAAALVYPRALLKDVLPRTSTAVDPFVTTIPESVLASVMLFRTWTFVLLLT